MRETTLRPDTNSWKYQPFRYAKPTDRQSFDRDENRIQQTKQISE